MLLGCRLIAPGTAAGRVYIDMPKLMKTGENRTPAIEPIQFHYI
jgi:hypothetical protein